MDYAELGVHAGGSQKTILTRRYLGALVVPKRES